MKLKYLLSLILLLIISSCSGSFDIDENLFDDGVQYNFTVISEESEIFGTINYIIKNNNTPEQRFELLLDPQFNFVSNYRAKIQECLFFPERECIAEFDSLYHIPYKSDNSNIKIFIEKYSNSFNENQIHSQIINFFNQNQEKKIFNYSDNSIKIIHEDSYIYHILYNENYVIMFTYFPNEDILQDLNKLIGLYSKTYIINPDEDFCLDIYEPVCGQPPMPKCPVGLNCAEVMPALKTYSNMCYLEKAGAEFVHNGVCEDNKVNDTYTLVLGEFEKELIYFNNNQFEINLKKVNENSIELGFLIFNADKVMNYSFDNIKEGFEYFLNDEISFRVLDIVYSLRENVLGYATIEFFLNPTIEVCSSLYQPVCGQPIIECNEFSCPAIAAMPTTYHNMCYLNKFNAEYLYDGECEDPNQNVRSIILSEGASTKLSLNKYDLEVEFLEARENNLDLVVKDYSKGGLDSAVALFSSIKENDLHKFNSEISFRVIDYFYISREQLKSYVEIEFYYDKNFDSCIDVYAPVCGQPVIDCVYNNYICPVGEDCPVNPCSDIGIMPTTYDNMCYLEKAGAQFLYNGTCEIDSGNNNYILDLSDEYDVYPRYYLSWLSNITCDGLNCYQQAQYKNSDLFSEKIITVSKFSSNLRAEEYAKRFAANWNLDKNGVYNYEGNGSHSDYGSIYTIQKYWVHNEYTIHINTIFLEETKFYFNSDKIYFKYLEAYPPKYFKENLIKVSGVLYNEITNEVVPNANLRSLSAFYSPSKVITDKDGKFTFYVNSELYPNSYVAGKYASFYFEIFNSCLLYSEILEIGYDSSGNYYNSIDGYKKRFDGSKGLNDLKLFYLPKANLHIETDPYTVFQLKYKKDSYFTSYIQIGTNDNPYAKTFLPLGKEGFIDVMYEYETIKIPGSDFYYGPEMECKDVYFKYHAPVWNSEFDGINQLKLSNNFRGDPTRLIATGYNNRIQFVVKYVGTTAQIDLNTFNPSLDLINGQTCLFDKWAVNNNDIHIGNTVTMTNGQEAVLSFDCYKGSGLNKGDLVKGDIIIEYYDPRTPSLIMSSVGSMATRVQ